MAGEWNGTTLADVSRDVSYGFTESATSEMVGPKFLRITDIQGGVVNWESVPYCPISADNHDKYKLKNGDIVVARTGNSTGENYLFRGGADAVFASYLIRFRLDTMRVDPRFIWYNLRAPRWWGFINSSKTGSAQAGANAKVLGRFPLKLPPLSEQQAIACVLGSLDDKIELNRKMNRTLEEMARAIFKSWFVDFDPVRAKEAVRREHPDWSDEQLCLAACPKLKPEIAALFPDALEGSELGEIPGGWRVGNLGDIIQILDSKRIPLSSRERQKRQGSCRYYGAAGIVDYVDDFLFDGIYVLVGEDGSVVTTAGTPVVQYVWGKFWVNNHAHVLKAAGGVTDEHLLLLLQQVYVTPFVTGAVQPKLSQTNMKAIPVIHGSPELNQEFGCAINPLYAKLRVQHDQIRSLVAVREALLPNLISGDMRVPDAEKFLRTRGLL